MEASPKLYSMKSDTSCTDYWLCGRVSDDTRVMAGGLVSIAADLIWLTKVWVCVQFMRLYMYVWMSVHVHQCVYVCVCVCVLICSILHGLYILCALAVAVVTSYPWSDFSQLRFLPW